MSEHTNVVFCPSCWRNPILHSGRPSSPSGSSGGRSRARLHKLLAKWRRASRALLRIAPGPQGHAKVIFHRGVSVLIEFPADAQLCCGLFFSLPLPPLVKTLPSSSSPRQSFSHMTVGAVRTVLADRRQLDARLGTIFNFHRRTFAAELCFHRTRMRCVHFNFCVLKLVGRLHREGVYRRLGNVVSRHVVAIESRWSAA
jgi:hypothetical protein